MQVFPLNLQLCCLLVFAFCICVTSTHAVLDCRPLQLAQETANRSNKVDDFETGNSAGVTFSNPIVNRWRVGVSIQGSSRSAKNLLITIPVPVDWPEQTVLLHEENIPPDIRSVEYRELNSGVRQLVATIPHLAANQLIGLSVIFDVTTSRINGPTDTSLLEIPKRLPREVKEYLGVSPQISYRNAKLRNRVNEIISEQESDWKKVEALFDWVRDNIQQRTDVATDTLTVFHRQTGCSEDRVGLFVAMCRAAKVPARMVWVDGAQYAEFYLVDPAGDGHWFPCQVAGHREFGGNTEPRIILQKGDNIRVPEKEHRQKYCAEFVTGAGNAKPVVKFVRGQLPAD